MLFSLQRFKNFHTRVTILSILFASAKTLHLYLEPIKSLSVPCHGEKYQQNFNLRATTLVFYAVFSQPNKTSHLPKDPHIHIYFSLSVQLAKNIVSKHNIMHAPLSTFGSKKPKNNIKSFNFFFLSPNLTFLLLVVLGTKLQFCFSVCYFVLICRSI